jgi:hypothetical protein
MARRGEAVLTRLTSRNARPVQPATDLSEGALAAEAHAAMAVYGIQRSYDG